MASFPNMHRRSTLRSARGKPQRTIWLCILSSIALCAIVNYYWIASGGGDETPEPESVHLRRASSSQGPPRGQHLSLDLVGASFHSTETAMHDITRKMLSSIGITSQLATSTSAPLNGGVSVMMAFQDYSQFTIQTWPEHERAIIDLFIRGGPDESINLQDALPIICQAYGADLAKSTFSITPRGDHTRASTNGEDSSSDDTTEKKKNHFHPVEIMSQHKVKTKIYEKQSPFQHIAIWDHHDFTDDDYETTMTRSLFLDGVIQSNIHDEARYHESLVHTAFIAASTPPKRVLIVGGGEGATLRETLKWASVEHVTMVDLDPDVIDASRRFLPSYSKCTGFGAASCFDDDRLDLYTEDFIAWFDKHIGNDICEKQEEKKDLLYDVIIIDLLDTEELPEGQAWAEHLYSELFFERIACALHTFGVVVSNFGEAPWFVGGEIQVSVHEKKMQAMFQKKIQQIQTMSSFFHHSRVYDTFVHSYRSDWAFAIGISPYNDAAEEGEEFKRALKDYGNVGINDFDGTPARVNLKLRRGLKQNAYPLQHYDGAVQHGFQYPIADWVSPYCADPAHEQICSISKKLFSVDYEEEWFEPRLNGNHDGKSGSFAKKDIKKGHVTGLWDAATALKIPATDFGALKTFTGGESKKYADLYKFLYIYGHDGGMGGTGDTFFCSLLSLHTFSNHACDHKPNFSNIYQEDSWTKDLWEIWNPVANRIWMELEHLTVATRDIAKGEMITDDYSSWEGFAHADDNKLGVHAQFNQFKEWCGEDYVAHPEAAKTEE